MPASDGVVWLKASGSVNTSVRWFAGVLMLSKSGHGNSGLQKKPARNVFSSPIVRMFSVTIRGPRFGSNSFNNTSARAFSEVCMALWMSSIASVLIAGGPYLIKYETIIGILIVLDAVKATSGFTEIASPRSTAKWISCPVCRSSRYTPITPSYSANEIFCWRRISRFCMVGRDAALCWNDSTTVRLIGERNVSSIKRTARSISSTLPGEPGEKFVVPGMGWAGVGGSS